MVSPDVPVDDGIKDLVVIAPEVPQQDGPVRSEKDHIRNPAHTVGFKGNALGIDDQIPGDSHFLCRSEGVLGGVGDSDAHYVESVPMVFFGKR